jgi:orsellinic acid C2-O-methyltransferase
MARAVCVAAELGIADVLADGPRPASELARLTGSHAPSLHRLLRALASLGLCVEREDGSFGLTPMGSLLRSHAPNSLRAWVLWFGKYQWTVWGQLLHSVQTGESARTLVTGSHIFGFLEGSPEAAAIFNDTMLQLTRLVAIEVASTYDFGAMRQVVDVGGGYGTLLSAVLERHRHLSGVLFDLPHAIEGARKQLATAGLGDRCSVVAGDFFERIPSGADGYLLKNIIHDWNDTRSASILANCRRAIPDHGKLLLIERVLPSRFEPSRAHKAIAYADLAMLVGPGGRERSEAEFGDLLHGAGFKMASVTSTLCDFSIVEAVPG